MSRDDLAPSIRSQSLPCLLVWLRATATAHTGSDIDLGIWTTTDIRHALSKARFALEESFIPYKVDLVDLQQTTPDFRQNALTEKILIQINSTLASPRPSKP